MIYIFSKIRGQLIILLVLFSQLFSTSCSKKNYPDRANHNKQNQANENKSQEILSGGSDYSKPINSELILQNIENKIDEKRSKEFLSVGSEKELDTHRTSANEIIRDAEEYLGVPHCMGGLSVKCIDCSGLLVVVFSQNGIYLPHSAEEQARYGIRINEMENLTAGDLIFFVRSYKTSKFITHSGIYIGDNKFIHTSTSSGVTITSLSDPWWNKKFIFGTRVFE